MSDPKQENIDNSDDQDVIPTANLRTGAVGPGSQIGPYKLLKILGEGGFAVVYLAEQQRPVKRRVAVKVIKPGMDTKQVVARFEAERQALALLDHPNVAHVYDAGTTELGRPYFVMEHVKGMQITEHCDRHKLTVEERLELFVQVCDAVQHAHHKGIIHRDLKPSTILVFFEAQKALPKVIDFGVAKAISQPLTERTLVTEHGEFIGTPAYMSPEQAEMTTQDIDTRSDIYSLGVVLYELLTGALPFDVKTLHEGGVDHIRHVIREEEPKTPSTRLSSLGEDAETVAERRRTEVRTLVRRLKTELEWIPLKAMRKERTRRYRSASEMADDIQNYLSGNPLIAGPETTTYKVQKFVRRHAGSVVTVAIVAVTIVLGLLVSTSMYFKAEKARVEADAARQKEAASRTTAEEAKKVAEERAEAYRRSLYVNHIKLAQESYSQSDTRRTREILSECPVDLRGWEWHRLSHTLDQSCMILKGHRVSAQSTAFSPDGRLIASGSQDNTIKIWDSATGSEVLTLHGHKHGISSLAFSPDGKQILSGSYDNTIRVWDVATGVEVRKLRGDQGVRSVAFGPKGKRIVSGGWERIVKVWDTESGAEVVTLRGHQGCVRSAVFSPNGKRIVSASDDQTIKIWDAESGTEIITLQGHQGNVTSVAFSPDGEKIVSASNDKTVKVWDAEPVAELITLYGHESGVLCVAFSSDGKQVASGGRDRMIRVWDSSNAAEIMTLLGHEATINSIAFSPKGDRLISASDDGTIRVWSSKIDTRAMTLPGHTGRVLSVAFSPDGRRIASGGYDAKIKIWDITSGAEIMTLSGHLAWSSVNAVAFSPDGRQIVSGGGDYDRTIIIWDAQSGGKLMTLLGHKAAVNSLVFSPDGQRIVSASEDKTVKLWDAEDGAQVMTLYGHDTGVRSVTFSPDGKRIASADVKRAVKVWDAVSGAELTRLAGHSFVVFSPDGKRIISGGTGATRYLVVWDAVSGADVMLLKSPSTIKSVVFSPDGGRIVSGSSDGAIRIWEATTGAEMVTLQEHKTPARSVAFSPNGKCIASGGDDGAIRVLETAAPPDGYASRQNAEAARVIVDQMHEQRGFYHAVIDELQAKKGLAQPVRDLALQIANSRRWEDADRLIKENQSVVFSLESDVNACKLAMGKIEMADRLDPNNHSILVVLGIAQCRTGAHKKGLEALTRYEKFRADTHQEPHPYITASIAIAQHQLGNAGQAQVALNKLRSLFEDPGGLNANSKGAQAYLIKAEKTIAGEGTKAHFLWEHIEAGELEQSVKMLEELRSLTDIEIAGPLEGAAKWLSRAYCNRAEKRGGGDSVYADMIADYELAVHIDPNGALALDKLGWLLATCPASEFRDGAKAVEYAARACELTERKNHSYVSTLAVACAESGDFAAAAKWQKQALGLLANEARADWQSNYEARMGLYESGKAFYEGSRQSISMGQMVAWWKLDRIEGDRIFDSSGNDLNGTLMGDASIVSDPKRWSVLKLNGDGFIDCGDNPAFNITGSITVVCWTKVTTFNRRWQTIISKGNYAWRLIRDEGNNALEFACTGIELEGTTWGNVIGSINVNDGKWHHVTGVYDGAEICLYIDGSLDSSAAASGHINSTNAPVYIGGSSERLGREWNGLIGDVRIYSYALSESEVKDLYEGKEPPHKKD